MSGQPSGKLGSTVQDPPSTLYKDPFATAPLDGTPLRICTADLITFPSEYLVERPRLIDVFHPSSRFAADTDCSRLRPMDAIVTILWSSDPVFLHDFYARWEDETFKVTWERSTSLEERFDLVIQRWGSVITLSLYEKEIRYGPESRRNENPYAQVMYKYLGDADARVDHTRWGSHVSESAGNAGSILIPGSDPVAAEDQGRRLARYLLLTRPWEGKAGVKFTSSYESFKEGKKREREPSHSEGNEWAYNYHKGRREMEGMELDDEGYPSKIDK